MNIIETTGLSKSYGKVHALNNLSLTIRQGEVFALLGPNGSGKTTTLGIILGVIFQNNGTYRWFEEENHYSQRRKIGAVLEMPNFYPYLSGTNNLKIASDIKGIDYSDIPRVLRIVGLEDRGKHRFRTYSYGMKQRLAIASALLGNPSVLILDEPTNGLDPQGIAEIRELILRIAAEGITIVLASHILDEVQKVCSHVAVLNKGNLIFKGSVKEMTHPGYTLEMASSDMTLLRKTILEIPEVSGIESESEHWLVSFSSEPDAGIINSMLHNKGILLNHLSRRTKSLESHFLDLLKKQ
ncbi:MAG: ATP-binding cassette domain-containing protein [Bacteroidales bacterium]|nr:ATP-binding cassette domain-containing protein [Bacteroidales bacterium]